MSNHTPKHRRRPPASAPAPVPQSPEPRAEPAIVATVARPAADLADPDAPHTPLVFRDELLTVTKLSGELAEVSLRFAVVEGVDDAGRLLLWIEGRLYVYSDVCGWRSGWEVARGKN